MFSINYIICTKMVTDWQVGKQNKLLIKKYYELRQVNKSKEELFFYYFLIIIRERERELFHQEMDEMD